MPEKKLNKKRATRRQEQILKAALEIFSRKGYTAATVPEIAREAGVAAGTIYIYYPSKRELFIAVIENLIITIPLFDLFEKVSAEGFPVIFKSIMQNRLDFVESNNISRLSSLMGEIMRDPELRELYAENLIQPIMSHMEEFYRGQMESGNFRQLDPTVVVRAIGGMVIGLIMLKGMEGENSPLNRLPKDKVADDILSLVLFGLHNQNRTGGVKKEDNA